MAGSQVKFELCVSFHEVQEKFVNKSTCRKFTDLIKSWIPTCSLNSLNICWLSKRPKRRSKQSSGERKSLKELSIQSMTSWSHSGIACAALQHLNLINELWVHKTHLITRVDQDGFAGGCWQVLKSSAGRRATEKFFCFSIIVIIKIFSFSERLLFHFGDERQVLMLSSAFSSPKSVLQWTRQQTLCAIVHSKQFVLTLTRVLGKTCENSWWKLAGRRCQQNSDHVRACRPSS